MTTLGVTRVDPTFERYVRLVRRSLGTPRARVSLDAEDRRQTALVIDDVRSGAHPVLPGSLGEGIAYAGWPLTDHTGEVVGSLYAIDSVPRAWSSEDLEVLSDLAAACSTELSERGMRAMGEHSLRLAEAMTHRSRVLLALSEALSATRTLSEVATAVEQVSIDQLGCLRAGLWITDVQAPVRTADLPALFTAEPGGLLLYVPPAGRVWHSARLHGALAVADDNPLGESLLTRRPLAFAQAEAQNARYPDLDTTQQVGDGRVFLPLLPDGGTVGAMALVWEGPRHLSPDELATLDTLASYTAQAVQRALLVQERLDALVVLQSALLPRLPEVGDLDLAARYRPAAERDQVGGDWYDAVVMPSGATSLMVGDVVGHDLVAAATMGQLRTMLRAIAWSTDEAPSLNVQRLDQAMRDLDVEGMATLGYARVEQDDGDRSDGRRTFRWTSAGHPPPLLVDPTGRATFLDDGPADLLLGVLPDSARSDNRIAVEAGSTVLLYTDGLVERRGEHLDAGLERLRRSAADRAGLPVGDFLDAVLDDLLDERLTDDVAVLAVRFVAPV